MTYAVSVMFGSNAATTLEWRAAKTMILKYNGSEEDASIKLKQGSTLLYSISKADGKTKIKNAAGSTVAANDVSLLPEKGPKMFYSNLPLPQVALNEFFILSLGVAVSMSPLENREYVTAEIADFYRVDTVEFSAGDWTSVPVTYEHLALTCFDFFKLGIEPRPGKCLHLQNQLDQNITCCLPSINPNETSSVIPNVLLPYLQPPSDFFPAGLSE